MGKKQNRLPILVDVANDIQRVGNCLKNLYHLINTVDWNPQNLESCLEITEPVLKRQIEKIDACLAVLASEFEGVDHKPIDMAV